MVDIKKRVESYDTGRMSPPVSLQDIIILYITNIYSEVCNIAFLSGIICITGCFTTGESLCHCRGKRRQKF